MAPARTKAAPREPVTRDRAIQVAVGLADAGGLESLSMRKLAQELGVEAMSLYYHVKNKDDLIDGMVDVVFGEIDLPSDDGGWRRGMYRRANSVRAVLRRHIWAIGLLESRTSPGPATLRHHEATLGVLRRAGFSMVMTSHAYALLDSYIYGFALQEAALPLTNSGSVDTGVAAPMVEMLSDGTYPYLFEMATERVFQPGYDFGDEFDIGLTVILDALEGWI